MGEEKVSIFIATHNEENNIGIAIERVRAVLADAEIIVVDDGSTDQTLARARPYENSSVKVFFTCHKGKGSAIKKAIQEASGTIMAQIDADLQFPAVGLPTLIKPILDGQADIVFGSRYLEPNRLEKNSVSFMKRILSHLAAIFISIVCGRRYTDVFAGFKAWKAKAIRDIDIQENSFAYEAEIVIKAEKRGYTVIEVPTDYKRRSKGKSKVKLLYHVFEITLRIIRMLLFAP
jgi:glycosyltransferase involved in cell wall biosynthesis